MSGPSATTEANVQAWVKKRQGTLTTRSTAAPSTSARDTTEGDEDSARGTRSDDSENDRALDAARDFAQWNDGATPVEMHGQEEEHAKRKMGDKHTGSGRSSKKPNTRRQELKKQRMKSGVQSWLDRSPEEHTPWDPDRDDHVGQRDEPDTGLNAEQLAQHLELTGEEEEGKIFLMGRTEKLEVYQDLQDWERLDESVRSSVNRRMIVLHPHSEQKRKEGVFYCLACEVEVYWPDLARHEGARKGKHRNAALCIIQSDSLSSLPADGGIRAWGLWKCGSPTPVREGVRDFWGTTIDHFPRHTRMLHQAGNSIEIEFPKNNKGKVVRERIPPEAVIEYVLMITPYSGAGKYLLKTVSHIEWECVPETETIFEAIPERLRSALGLIRGTKALGWWPIVHLRLKESFQRYLLEKYGWKDWVHQQSDVPEGRVCIEEHFSICYYQIQSKPMVCWPNRRCDPTGPIEKVIGDVDIVLTLDELLANLRI